MIRKLGNWAFGVVAAAWLNAVALRARSAKAGFSPRLRASVVGILFAIATLPAFGQGVLMQLPPVTDSMGHPIAGATVSVFTASGTLPNLTCGTPVTVYKDVGLTTPFTTLVTDGFGNFPFFIQPNSNPYGYTVSAAGTNTSICYGFSAPFAFNGPANAVLCLGGDTGLSRGSPAFWDLGNCTSGNTSGSLSLTRLFDTQIFSAAGTAAAPSSAFQTDSTTGSYLAALATYGISAGGSMVATFSASGVSTTSILTNAGSIGSPGVQVGSANTGWTATGTTLYGQSNGLLGAAIVGHDLRLTSGAAAGFTSSSSDSTLAADTSWCRDSANVIKFGNTAGTCDASGTLLLTNLKANGGSPLAVPTAGANVVSDTATQTITNKRVTPRAVAVTDATSITPNSDTSDIVTQTNTQGSGTLTINAPTGTPTDGQKLIIRIKSTNSQTYSFNAAYAFSTTVAAPTTLGAGKTDYIGCIWDATNSKWDVVAVDQGH